MNDEDGAVKMWMGKLFEVEVYLVVLGEAGGGQQARHGRAPVPFRYKYRCVELFPTRLCLLTTDHCPLSCKTKDNVSMYMRNMMKGKILLASEHSKAGEQF